MRQFWRHNIYQDGCTLPLSVVWISQWSSNQNSRVDPSHKSIRGYPQMIYFGGLIVQLWIPIFVSIYAILNWYWSIWYCIWALSFFNSVNLYYKLIFSYLCAPIASLKNSVSCWTTGTIYFKLSLFNVSKWRCIPAISDLYVSISFL